MITSKQAKEYRLSLGLSQNFISKATGLSRPYLSNFEAGKFDPDLEFKETLEAFFIKQGIQVDNAEQPKGDDDTKKLEYQETKVIKPINGIVPDIDFISYNEAVSIMGDIGLLNSDLLLLSEESMPTKEVGLPFLESTVIDQEESLKIIKNTIYRMAKAYIDIMHITGDYSINAVYDEEIPHLSELKTDRERSINEYILYFINNIDDNTTDTEQEE